MYGNLPGNTIGGGLAVTGLAMLNWVWLAVALIVIGGAIVAACNLAPRFAIESIPADGINRRRTTLTFNGKPLFKKKR